MKKTPSLNYVYNKIKTTKKSELYKQLEESPLTVREFACMSDSIAGLNLTELSDKYNLSYTRTSQWKREVCNKIFTFDMANIN
ncbi:MAG: hypothetical protein J6P07_09170 [Spirochaetaceae bacterium]|nr:hypothetical protein [Spirochaetaceae bacterium]